MILGWSIGNWKTQNLSCRLFNFRDFFKKIRGYNPFGSHFHSESFKWKFLWPASLYEGLRRVWSSHQYAILDALRSTHESCRCDFMIGYIGLPHCLRSWFVNVGSRRRYRIDILRTDCHNNRTEFRNKWLSAIGIRSRKFPGVNQRALFLQLCNVNSRAVSWSSCWCLAKLRKGKE